MEDVFAGVRSSDERVRQEATEFLMKKMEDESFLWTLVEILEKADKSDGGLVDTLAITILQMIRMKWTGGVYTIEMMSVFVQRITALVFAVPFAHRGNFVEIIDHVFLDQSLDFSGMVGVCESVVQRNELNGDLATAVEILSCYLFFKTSPRLPVTDAFEEMVHHFVALLVMPLRGIGELVARGEVLNEYTCSALKSIAKVLKMFVMKSKLVFQLGETREFLQILVSVLRANQTDAPMLSMKKGVLDDVRTCIAKFSPEWRPAYMNEMFTFICENVAPALWQSLAFCFSNEGNAPIRESLLFMVLVLLRLNMCVSEIVTPSFINNVMIPSCHLSPDDVSVFTEIPEQFLVFCYYIDHYFVETSRVIVACIINNLAQKSSEALDMILGCAMAESSTIEDFEARVFILACIAQHRPLDVNLGSLALRIINENKSPLLVAVGVLLLKNLKIEPEKCNHLSICLLTGCDVPVIQLLAIHLFQRSFISGRTQIAQPVQDVTKSLIHLANRVTDPKPGEMLDLLIRHFSEDFLPIAEDIVRVCLTTWARFTEMEDELPVADLLHSTARIIDSLPQDSECLYRMCDFVISVCCSMFASGCNSLSEGLLLGILSSLASQMTNPPLVMFQTILGFLNYFKSNTKVALTMVSDFFSFFVVLVKKADFLTLESGQFVKAIVEMCEIWMQDRTRTDALQYAASMIMLLIQVGGSQLSSLAGIAVAMIKEPGACPALFASWFSVVASGLLVDASGVLPLLDSNLIALILSRTGDLEALPLRYMNVCFMGLCALARSGVRDAFFSAAVLTKAIVTCERLQEIEEFPDDDVHAEYRSRNEIELPTTEFPSDSYDVRAFFKETEDATHLFDQLQPEVREFILTSFSAKQAL